MGTGKSEDTLKTDGSLYRKGDQVKGVVLKARLMQATRMRK